MVVVLGAGGNCVHSSPTWDEGNKSATGIHCDGEEGVDVGEEGWTLGVDVGEEGVDAEGDAGEEWLDFGGEDGEDGGELRLQCSLLLKITFLPEFKVC